MMRSRWMAMLLTLCCLPAMAIDPVPLLDDPVQQVRYQELIHGMRCLKCQGETVADTSAMFAVDIRRQVREMVQSGRTDQEIRQYMVDRYGELILLKPLWTWANSWLWFAPGLFLLGGIAIAWRILGQRRALLASDTSDVGEDAERS
jgi:cytochrome c-type biogenesis protein CcmH